MDLSDISLIGWCPPEKEDYLTKWIRNHAPSLIVEIGVYGGKSFIPMAYEARNYPSKCVGIDAWDKDVCLEGMTNLTDRAWWRYSSQMARVEASCRRAIHNLELKNVELWKGTSDLYKNSFQEDEIGLLSIDGNHGPQALIDGQNYLKFVAPGGLIACDDSWWEEGGVKTVQIMIDWLLSNGCIHLETIEGCAMLQKGDSPYIPQRD